MPKVPIQAVTNHSLTEDRLVRLEDTQQELITNFAVHEATDQASFASIKKDLFSIESKVDKVADAVGQQHELWVASQAKDETKKSRVKLWLAVLGVIASSGVIEAVLHHFMKG